MSSNINSTFLNSLTVSWFCNCKCYNFEITCIIENIINNINISSHQLNILESRILITDKDHELYYNLQYRQLSNTRKVFCKTGINLKHKQSQLQNKQKSWRYEIY